MCVCVSQKQFSFVHTDGFRCMECLCVYVGCLRVLCEWCVMCMRVWKACVVCVRVTVSVCVVCVLGVFVFPDRVSVRVRTRNYGRMRVCD